MLNSCAKCGRRITYGVICGQCFLGSNIVNKLSDNTQDNYNSTLQPNYSGFRSTFNSGKLNSTSDEAAEKLALKKYLMDPKRYNSTSTKKTEFNAIPKYVFKNYDNNDSIDSKIENSRLNNGASKDNNYILVISKNDNSIKYVVELYLDSKSDLSKRPYMMKFDDAYLRSLYDKNNYSKGKSAKDSKSSSKSSK